MSTNIQVFLMGFGPLLLLGLGLFYYGLRQRARARASHAWPQVVGKALTAEVKRQVFHNRKSGTSQTWYQPQVEYEYVVNDVHFRASRIAFGSMARKTEEAAQAILDQVVKSDAVQAHYNPHKPGEAVLLTGNAPGSLGYVIGGAVICAAALFFWLYFFVF